MEEKHQNRTISVNSDGRLSIDNQEVDSDMILFEEEAKSLLEKELMEGPLSSYSENEDAYLQDYFDYDYTGENSLDDDIFFNEGYNDISNDEFDTLS